ncbi:MAG TPA: DUF1684 domain-containing protein, partial [Nitrososphaerales archaeon]|nr:DUF1684 domain-containing protein [Nitrososphaerales archaeon]
MVRYFVDPDEVETWQRALVRFRAQRDEFMLDGRGSPFLRGGSSFTRLKYFEPDPAFRFEAGLRRRSDEKGVMMTTTKGARQLYNDVGHFDLLVGGEAVRLTVYQSAEREDPYLFIPFR